MPRAMRRKHLKFTDFQGRQLQELLDSHLGMRLTPQTRAVVQSAGRTINIWVLCPASADGPVMRAPLPPQPMPAATPAARPLDPDAPAEYDWQTPSDTVDDVLAMADSPLRVLSAIAVCTAAAAPGWPSLGLSRNEFTQLQQVMSDLAWPELPHGMPADGHHAGASTLCEWLWSYRRSSQPLTRAVAAAVACASFSNKPLWADLGLSGRDPLNTLLQGHFPALYRLNTTHMGWKKFFLLKLPQLLPGSAARQR